MRFLRIKICISTCLALIFFLCALLFVWGTNVDRFSALEGERTFYLHSSSSQALIKRELSLRDVGKIRGESVAFTREKQTEEECLKEILTLYRAEVLFSEQVGETISYYCYTSQWTDGLELDGLFVNLHVAFREEACTVGAPLIFGGF